MSFPKLMISSNGIISAITVLDRLGSVYRKPVRLLCDHLHGERSPDNRAIMLPLQRILAPCTRHPCGLQRPLRTAHYYLPCFVSLLKLSPTYLPTKPAPP